jgi:hypothetical protein
MARARPFRGCSPCWRPDAGFNPTVCSLAGARLRRGRRALLGLVLEQRDGQIRTFGRVRHQFHPRRLSMKTVTATQEMGRKMVATAASRRLTTPRCLFTSAACRPAGRHISPRSR